MLEPAEGETYLVGGAVRDALLGRRARERDWVVVGATPESLERQGFRRVGRDFPVFLHPITHEEYALARTERKTAAGHTGFECYAGPDVTLEQDLLRRDLTVNALAQTADGRLIDPWGGERDLAARLLRHVSPAFVEDPLRVLRVARFAAELAPLAFTVAEETESLMRTMARRGDLAELAAERIWQELVKALAAPAPARFFEVLERTDALVPWFAELVGHVSALPALFAPFADILERFGALGHIVSSREVAALCDRLKSPRRYRRLAETVAILGPTLSRFRAEDPVQVLRALRESGGLRRWADFGRLLRVLEGTGPVSLDGLRELVARLRGVSASELKAQGLDGARLGAALEREMLALIAADREAARAAGGASVGD